MNHYICKASECTERDREELQDYVERGLPGASHLRVRVCCNSVRHVVLEAPLEENSNDKGTGFAGSISAVAMLACWACVRRVWRDVACGSGGEGATVVAKDVSVHFRRPVVADFVAVCCAPSADALAAAQKEWAARGRAHISVCGAVYNAGADGAPAGAPALECEGCYVVLPPAAAGAKAGSLAAGRKECKE